MNKSVNCCMRYKLIWMLFLFLIALLAIWFVFMASCSLISYYRYSLPINVMVEKWEQQEVDKDQFVIIAHYQLEYNGIIYRHESAVGDPYPNPWAAQRAISHFENQKWVALINPKDANQAVLEKKFPYKKVLSALLLVGLVFYFALLAIYVRRKNG